jgi:small-conductance mechanosensitive channel
MLLGFQQVLVNVDKWLETVPLPVRQVAAAVLVAILTLVAYRLVMRSLERMHGGGKLPLQVFVPLRRVVRIFALAAGVLLVLQQFNVLADAWSTLTALFAVIGAGFIATWSILSNSFCALVLLVTRPFQVGDEIEMLPEQLRGQVVDFNLIFTILLCDDGSTIQIPNNLFFQRMFRRRRGVATVALEEQLDKQSAVKDA